MKSKIDDFSQAAQIMLQLMRDKNSGLIVSVRHVDLTPGMRIERCGRVYQIDKNGTQRRVK